MTGSHKDGDSTAEKYTGYLVGKVLGLGTYAKVRQAYSTKFKENVALKIIDKRKIPPSYEKKFLDRELKLIWKMKHENIVTFLDNFDHEHLVGYV